LIKALKVSGDIATASGALRRIARIEHLLAVFGPDAVRCL